MYLKLHDALIIYGGPTVGNRPAVFLGWKWKGRIYADIEYTDTNERGTCHIMDIQPLAQACVDLVREAFELEAAQ